MKIEKTDSSKLARGYFILLDSMREDFEDPGQEYHYDLLKKFYSKSRHSTQEKRKMYERAVALVSGFGEREDRFILDTIVIKYPEVVSKLRRELFNLYGSKIRVYRNSQGQPLRGIESFYYTVPGPSMIRYIDIVLDANTSSIVAHAEIQGDKIEGFDNSETEALIKISWLLDVRNLRGEK